MRNKDLDPKIGLLASLLVTTTAVICTAIAVHLFIEKPLFKQVRNRIRNTQVN